MKFERGFISPYFQTNPKTQKCEMENAYVLLYEKKISGEEMCLPQFAICAQKGPGICAACQNNDFVKVVREHAFSCASHCFCTHSGIFVRAIVRLYVVTFAFYM